MAKSDASNDKKAGRLSSTFSQIKQVYSFTREENPNLALLLATAFCVPLAAEIVLGIIFHFGIAGWILWTITALLCSAIAAMTVLSKKADKVGYEKIEGQPGATGVVLETLNKNRFYRFPKEPVWADPRTKDCLWRGTGLSGIFLVGEGNYGRVSKAMDKQEKSLQRITAGSAIPVYRIYSGNGPKQTRLSEVAKQIRKVKKAKMTRDEFEELNKRLATIDKKNQILNIPGGIDPNRPQRISRRAMRGK